MKPIETIVIVTGGFDPVHSGHINYIRAAKELGDYLVVGLNSDAWLSRKKGRAFMPWNERHDVLDEMTSVDWIIDFDDRDDSARDAIRKVKERFPKHTIIFANGGDRTATNIPEMTEQNVIFKFGVGGDTKANSSSWILEDWKAPKTERSWGYYRVLHEVSGTKVKELTINPGQRISLQRHFKRNEFWFVTHGACDVFSTMSNGYALPVLLLHEHLHHFVLQGEWHQLRNPYEVPCKIVEIQYGESCTEDDIERR
jgi:D-beta-D-heptose 7-phosphate kinase/D-beta-D-heptose 1-phosphate adenosyltransferase